MREIKTYRFNNVSRLSTGSNIEFWILFAHEFANSLTNPEWFDEKTTTNKQTKFVLISKIFVKWNLKFVVGSYENLIENMRSVFFAFNI